jgi:hypothetical protein
LGILMIGDVSNLSEGCCCKHGADGVFVHF